MAAAAWLNSGENGRRKSGERGVKISAAAGEETPASGILALLAENGIRRSAA